MKIGILYLCTGRYTVFFNRFYSSCENKFLPDSVKNYLVFTDNPKQIKIRKKNIRIFSQQFLGWPDDTLHRFHIFSKIEDLLEEMDYLFFFNANILFRKIIGHEILPTKNDNWLVGVQHPGFFNKNPMDFTYERNPVSSACIEMGKGNIYYAGGLNGGRTQEFLHLIHTLKNNIQTDHDNGQLAIWHDESHLNKYFIDHPPRTLDPGYLYPEGSKIPFEKRIILLNKNYWGGHAFLRQENDEKLHINILDRLRYTMKYHFNK